MKTQIFIRYEDDIDFKLEENESEMFCLEDDVKEDDIKEDDHSSEISSYQVEIRENREPIAALNYEISQMSFIPPFHM